MSGQAPWGYDAPPEPPAAQPTGVNGLGIAGFVIGIVGFCVLGGLLAPLGLLLSIIGLFKQPRGWAVAGTVVNLGTLCCCVPLTLPIILVAVGVVSLSAMTLWITDTFAGSLGARGVTGLHIGAIFVALSMYFAEHQKVPDSLDAMGLDPRMLTDGWGRPFQYQVTDDPEGFRLWTVGRDGVEGTGDDLEFQGVVRGGGLSFDEVRKRPTQSGTGTAPSEAPTDAPSGAPTDPPADAPAGTPPPS